MDKRRKVWLDCDPGHDDAFAIMLAGHNPNLELIGISTVHGNQSVKKTTSNALKTLSVSGLTKIKVVPGQSKPLVRPDKVCPEIHGESGLDCSDSFSLLMKKEESLHHDQLVSDKKAIIYMYETFSNIASQGEKVTLVATGTLTNVALLLTVFPEVKETIEQIVLLGGAMGIGNMSPSAEWNILVDPEAAKIVFEAGVKLVMIPLEVSHTALVTPEIVDRIRKMDTQFSALCIDLLHFFAETYKRVFHFEYPPLHDPLAVAYVINPSIFETVLMRVDIETVSELTSGRTICDIYHMSKLPKNVFVGQKVNVEEFWNLLISSLTLANSVSSLNKI